MLNTVLSMYNFNGNVIDVGLQVLLVYFYLIIQVFYLLSNNGESDSSRVFASGIVSIDETGSSSQIPEN